MSKNELLRELYMIQHQDLEPEDCSDTSSF